jgi:hypothetical protein
METSLEREVMGTPFNDSYVTFVLLTNNQLSRFYHNHGSLCGFHPPGIGAPAMAGGYLWGIIMLTCLLYSLQHLLKNPAAGGIIRFLILQLALAG